MTQVAPFTTLLAARTNLQVMDPAMGPVERPAEELHAKDEVLVIAGGRPCYRQIAQAAPAAPPQTTVAFEPGCLSPGVPLRRIEIASRQKLAIAFPLDIATVPAEEISGAMVGDASGHWIAITVEDAEAFVVEGLRQATGPLASEPARDISEPAAAPELQPEPRSAPSSGSPGAIDAPPLKAHAGLRELPAQYGDRSGILTTWRFTVPPRTTTIRLSSHSRQPDGDPRHLGIAIYRLVMDETPIPLDSPALVRGFHRAETGQDLTWRWTDGEALLILPPRPSEQILSVGITDWHLMLVL